MTFAVPGDDVYRLISVQNMEQSFHLKSNRMRSLFEKEDSMSCALAV